MVITVTLNPALDRTLTVEGIQVDVVNRVVSTRTDIGGKGINVSKVLSVMGTPSTVLGFIGINHKEMFEKELDKLGIGHHLILVEGESRTNIKIVDPKNRTFTDLNEAGPVITPGELDEFFRVFDEMVSNNDIIVLAGGLPKGVPDEIYGILTEKSKEKGARVVLDADGKSLAHGVKAGPSILKPNEKEFLGLLKREHLFTEEIARKAADLASSGIEKILVSRGEKGSILVTAEHALLSESQAVEVKSTAGAGDAMVAALVKAEIDGLSDFETLALAQAASTAAVMTEGTEVPDHEEVFSRLDAARKNIREISTGMKKLIIT